MRMVVAFFVLFLHASAGSAAERYFLIVFGSQRPIVNHPNHTHSWATFVRACYDGDTCQPHCMDYFSVSWLACSEQLRVAKPFAEPGKNVDLHDTLDWALADRQRVAYWGPYEIAQELYATAYEGAGTLNSGAVRYKMVDTGRITSRVSNCIHAVSDLATGQPKLRIGTPGWGHSASYLLQRTSIPGSLIGRRRIGSWSAWG
jgi:hypothetical protein